MIETYTINLSELYDIALKIHDKYVDISEYKYMQVKGIKYDEEELEKELDELKLLLLQERVLYDSYYKKWTSDEVEMLLSIESEKEDLIFNRIQSKILEVMHDPYIISREALNNLKFECRIIVDKNEEREMYQDILNELNTEKFTVDGPEIEVFKNFLTFLSMEIEKQKDDEVLKLLIMEFFFSIFSDPRLEEKIVNDGFKIDKQLIRISDSVSLSNMDYKEYKENLNELLTQKTSATLIELLQDEQYEEGLENENINFVSRILQTIARLFNYKIKNIDMDEYMEIDEAYLKSINILLKCDLRAAMYVFDDKHFEKYIKFLKEVIKNNENELGVELIKQAIEEARQDRETLPKMILLSDETNLEKAEVVICQLYEELINYQKRRYNGEDVDKDIQLIIDKIKEERVIEFSKLKKELLEDFDEEDLELYGQISLSFKSKFETLETKTRLMEMANKFARYLSLNMMGYDAKLYEENDDSLEVNKNILFFLEQAINCTEGDVRDFLIEFKYSMIYSSYGLEEIAIQSNFEISKEHLCFPSIIVNDIDEKIDYYNQSKENIFKKLEIVLNEFHSMNKTITPCMEGQIYKYISLFRGMLYTLGDKSFQTYSDALELATPQIRDEVTISLLQTAMELSTLDRETYKKLIF